MLTESENTSLAKFRNYQEKKMKHLMEINKKIILDLCAGTGSWSEPYKKAGYDVHRVTLPDYDVRSYQIPIGRVYGILAAPPCNEFSKLKRTNRDLLAGWEVVKACLEIIWSAGPGLKFWAMENPRGYLCRFLGLPPYSFDPYDFGAGYSKRTWLWGYFNRPARIAGTNYVKYKNLTRSIGRANYSDFQSLTCKELRSEGLIGKTFSDVRACTNPLFAEAFFRANK
jgi:hypothetical protein